MHGDDGRSPDPLAGTLPDWPDDAPPGTRAAERSRLDDELAGLEARVEALSAEADPELQASIRALLELHERRCAAADARLRERAEVLAAVHRALDTLRAMPSVAAMVAAAPQHACRACGFDRAVLYRVHGHELIAESFWVEGDHEAAARLLAFSRAHPGILVSEARETDMVRRRRAMAVEQAVRDPSSVGRLFAAYDTRSYVAAPIMPEGRVIGFIHADHRLTPRRVDDADRDALWAFAEGFGHAVERARLSDRLRAQGQELRDLLRRTDAVVAEYLDAEIELDTRPSGGTDTARAAAALLGADDGGLAATLSRRELEVLALLGAGASNADIAARLVISEDTAKSHVKRILRKLGAANRVEAATIWLRTRPPG